MKFRDVSASTAVKEVTHEYNCKAYHAGYTYAVSFIILFLKKKILFVKFRENFYHFHGRQWNNWIKMANDVFCAVWTACNKIVHKHLCTVVLCWSTSSRQSIELSQTKFIVSILAVRSDITNANGLSTHRFNIHMRNLQGDQKVTDSGFNKLTETLIDDGPWYFKAMDDARLKN